MTPGALDQQSGLITWKGEGLRSGAFRTVKRAFRAGIARGLSVNSPVSVHFSI
jgi:hypothetical protein